MFNVVAKEAVYFVGGLVSGAAAVLTYGWYYGETAETKPEAPAVEPVKTPTTIIV